MSEKGPIGDIHRAIPLHCRNVPGAWPAPSDRARWRSCIGTSRTRPIPARILQVRRPRTERIPQRRMSMKKIGFLSFGHWTPSPQSQTRSASDALVQSIDLAVAAEELGANGAYFRVHHFARQLGSPLPLRAAVVLEASR